MSKLTYKDEDHTYYIDGVWVPSVTQVIGPLNDFDKIPRDILNNKADWGRKIDSMIEYHIDGCLDETSLNDAQKRVLEQFFRFLEAEGRDYAFDRCVTKHRGCNERLMYAGESDLIFPEVAIIDVKTRKLNKITDPLQLWGYNGIYSKTEHKHYVLSLYENKYEFRQVNKTISEMKQSGSRFRCMLDKVWNDINFNNKIKIWRKQK